MSSMAKLKIAGAWAGVVEVELENWTVPMLREEVAKRSNMAPEFINLIFAGRVLKDDDGSEKLTQLGIKNNSKILACRVSLEEGKSLGQELIADEERDRRLARVKAAVTALSKRHADGSLPIEDFNIELEDQNGKKLQFSETDQQAIMMGLMLHANGKRLIRKQMFKDALEVLTMGEEAFSLCNPKSIELVDNIPILQIDMVWCYFMLKDIAWLTVAGVRLEKAREGLERAYGKDSSRFRLLQAGRSSYLALYLRLELLEGVVAYHSGQFDKSRKYLTSAQVKFSQLQVPDEALSIVMSMGFRERDAKRALRMSNQDVQSAVDFLIEERAKRVQMQKENIRRRDEIMEQKQYGVTPLKKAVDLQRLNVLVSIGFERELVAEALRRNENDTQKALDDLTNPEINTSIQRDIESRKRKRQQQEIDSTIEELVSRGFERSTVLEAFQTGGCLEEGLCLLLQPRTNQIAAADNNAVAPDLTSGNNAVAPDLASGNNASASDVTPDDLHSDVTPDACQESLNPDDDTFGRPSSSEHEQRDVEMEDEIAEELAKGDAFSDYDVEVTKEGEAINEYLALLDSRGIGEKASTSMGEW